MDPKAYEVICDSSDREAWLAARRTLVTASDVATVMGVNPWHEPLTLYLDKAGIVAAPDLDSEAVEWGHTLEEPIARAYSKRTGRVVEMAGKLLRSREFPWLGATLDATTTVDGIVIPLEIKTTGVRGGDHWEDGAPAWYVAQVQTQMIVTGAKRASIACLIGGQRMVWQDIDADPAMQAQIIDAAREFMRRVAELDPPPPGASEEAHRALLALYPKEDGEAIAFDQEAVAWDDRITEINAEIKALETEKRGLTNQIEAAIGSAVKGVLPGGIGAWQWATVHKDAYTVTAKDSRQLRRVKK